MELTHETSTVILVLDVSSLFIVHVHLKMLHNLSQPGNSFLYCLIVLFYCLLFFFALALAFFFGGGGGGGGERLTYQNIKNK